MSATWKPQQTAKEATLQFALLGQVAAYIGNIPQEAPDKPYSPPQAAKILAWVSFFAYFDGGNVVESSETLKITITTTNYTLENVIEKLLFAQKCNALL